MNTPYTHVVQAWGTGIEWVDCYVAVSYQHAMFKERQLKESDGWLSQTKIRRTRIVPISEANCGYNKD